MKAMVLNEICDLRENKTPLELVNFPDPVPLDGEIVIKVAACGVCHTELDEIEGRTPPPTFPMILGHQVVGEVIDLGKNTKRFKKGNRVGVAWIYSTCGNCYLCQNQQENLCADFKATGRDAHGGYAEYIKIHQDFAYPIPDIFSDEEVAPLLCAGAIGYRSLSLTEFKEGDNLGLTGFGGSAHLVIKMVLFLYPKTKVYVFARNRSEREFSRELGAVWAGDIDETSPEKIHKMIDTTPVWKPIIEAMRNLTPGGRLVINAIRKEEIDKDYLLKLDYADHVWMEKEIKSVANVTRRDVDEFLKLAAKMKIKPEVETYKLEEANQALIELKETKIRGAKVLKIE